VTNPGWVRGSTPHYKILVGEKGDGPLGDASAPHLTSGPQVLTVHVTLVHRVEVLNTAK
jgi:hypothetical protein